MGKSKIQNPKSKIKEDIFLLLDPGAADGRLRFLFVNGRGEIAVRYAFAPHRKAIEHVLAIIAGKMKSRSRPCAGCMRLQTPWHGVSRYQRPQSRNQTIKKSMKTT